VPQILFKYQDQFVELAERLLTPQQAGRGYSIGICPVQNTDSTSRLAALLAICMSQVSRSPVLLIEATVHMPCLALNLHTPMAPGLRDLALPSGDNWDDCIHPTSDQNLFLLPGGTWKPVDRFESFEQRLRLAHALAVKRYRSVIVELSGWEDFEECTEARACYALPDAVILAVMPNSYGAVRLRRAVRRLRRAHANLAGSILNEV